MLGNDPKRLEVWIFGALTALAGLWHLMLLPTWPGWREGPGLFAFAVEVVVPIAALVAVLVAVALNLSGHRWTPWRLMVWTFTSTGLVLMLDGCRGTIGFID